MRLRLLQILLLVAALTSVAIGATSNNIPQDTTSPMVVKILGAHDQIQGHNSYVSIIKMHGPDRLSGFNLLIAYDSSVMVFASVELGSAFKDSGCNWTYSTETGNSAADCPGTCSFGLLRLVASAPTPDQPTTQYCSPLPDTSELFKIKFLVTNNRAYECASTPVRFYWQDCLDNSFRAIYGDSVFVSRQVFDPGREITALDCKFECHCGGACPRCDAYLSSSRRVRLVDFYNGVVDVVCIDWGGTRGDINLNGIANEIPDARVLADAILRGLSVLPSVGREEAIRNCDVNADDRPMTVADLVYLQRIIIGDALPFTRLHPSLDTATIDFSQSLFSVKSSVDVGAVMAVFDCDSNCKVESLTGFSTTYFYDLTVRELRVLVMCDIGIYDTAGNSGCYEKRLPVGENRLFTIHGRAKLKEAQVSDYNGSLLLPLSRATNLPMMFAASSEEYNWPLRGNARIVLNLPYKTDWRIDIYDNRHQPVSTYNGSDIGQKTVVLDVANFCPGTYTYTVTAGSFTSTRPLIGW
jgi:hypothetical protein